jgi:tetratricopeptide (TPR) repeat protein
VLQIRIFYRDAHVGKNSVKYLAATVLSVTLATPVIGVCETLSGAYLAARQADLARDYTASEQYYGRALLRDPNNPSLLESQIMAHMSLGLFAPAMPLAQRLDAQGVDSQLLNMMLIAGAAQEGAYGRILDRIEQGKGIGSLIDSLLSAWAITGQGQMSTALAAFDTIAEKPGVKAFSLYHKGLALASVGDYESASKIFLATVEDGVRLTRRGVIAQLQVLSQLDQNTLAIAALKTNFGASLDPEIANLRQRLIAGETLEFDIVRSPLEGISEVFYSIANILTSDAEPDYTLLYTRIAKYLRPDHLDAALFSASLLEELEQYDLASQSYAKIPLDAPSFHNAELGRADTLRLSGNIEASIEVLEALARTHGGLSIVHSTLGDTLRREDAFAGAVEAYDRAVALYGGARTSPWFVLYARGICQERLGNWAESEADLRAALALAPDQPQVLNYLGYSLVEKQVKLQEALSLIQRAETLRPQSGYIVDSLGWVLFRLGHYTQAVPHMERAIELMPVDPIVNDHLGDVYWSVGRRLEAEFQWHRALSFKPEESEAIRIRRKLEVGLDQLLDEEGAPPLELVLEDG